MEREEILRRSKDLPTIHPAKIAEDHEIWEGNEEGAHFKITRNYVPEAPSVKFYTLSFSGPKRGRERIISGFKEVFGEPDDQYTVPQVPGVHFLSWNADKVDPRLLSED